MGCGVDSDGLRIVSPILLKIAEQLARAGKRTGSTTGRDGNTCSGLAGGINQV
jgi:hypothetical protein